MCLREEGVSARFAGTGGDGVRSRGERRRNGREAGVVENGMTRYGASKRAR